MIALGLAAAVAVRLSPPLDAAIRYHVVDVTPGDAGETRVDTGMSLRFRRQPEGTLIAAARTETIAVAAPAPIKARLDLLFGPLLGATTQGEVEADGSVGALVDPEPSWRAFRASQQAILARIEAMPDTPPGRRALAERSVRQAIDPARRDEMLRPGLAQLLPPVLPPLAPGATRTSTTNLPTPDGAIAAESRVTLLWSGTAAGRRLTYHVETVTAPVPSGGARFAAISDVEIDRQDGMVALIRARRELRRPGQAPVTISTHVVERESSQ